MKLAISDEVERTTADARPVIRSSDEAGLVASTKAGNANGFDELFMRHEARIFRIALRITRNHEDAEDVVQQSFQKTFVHMHKFEGKSSFSTWLTRIAINEALMSLRRSRGLREISIDDSTGSEERAFALEIPDSRPSPESSYSQRERERVLSAAMKELEPRTRKVIELRELGDLSTRETARRMGLSAEAVKGRLFHGRRKLRKTWSRSAESVCVSGKQAFRLSPATKGISTSDQFACNVFG
jgi:RNA polymerase sigma-70 factor (ECF subfamily)